MAETKTKPKAKRLTPAEKNADSGYKPIHADTNPKE